MTKRKSRLRCPKCKSNTLAVTEYIICGGEWFQEDGFLSEKAVNDPGEYFKVSAECFACDYRWTVRNAIQITDIIKE